MRKILLLILSFLLISKVTLAEDLSKSEKYNFVMKQDLLCMFMAYPDYISSIENCCDENVYLVLKSGKKILYDDGKMKNPAQKLANPDIQDMLEQIYPLSNSNIVLEDNFDPGRCRIYELLKDVYGTSKTSVGSNLSKVFNYQFNKNNGAANALTSVFNDLVPLAKKNGSIGRCLFPASGTFNYRQISGTGQLSPHAFGIAIDLAVNKNDYWKWASKKAGIDRINSYPKEIVESFERNCFIWGGKWSHFDTMHFEYRPEIILKARYFGKEMDNRKLWYEGAPESDPLIKGLIEKIDSSLKL